MAHFAKVRAKRPSPLPMQTIIAFAIFGTCCQEEITRIVWSGYEKAAF
jgi:hypothetical protein